MPNKRDAASPRVMGIDPALSNLAVTVMSSSENETWLTHSANQGKSVRARIARYLELADWVMQIAETYRPTVVCIEGYSHGSKGSAALSLAEFGGVLRTDLCELDGAVLLEIAPIQLKKFVTGKGSGDKTRVIAAATKRWGCEFDTDHEYDAYGLARMALVIAGESEAETAAQRAVVSTILGR